MADSRDILVRLLGEETVSRMAGRAGDGLDKFGDKLEATEKDAHDLDRQIAEVEGSLKTLATAFSRTSDAADRVDLTKAMRRQQSELRKLTKVKGLLGDAAQAGAQLGTAMAGSMGSTVSKGMSGVFQSMPPQVQGVVVAAGAAIGVTMSAAIGAALTAGVLLAVSGGVLALGIKAAADSPEVQAAWKSFGDRGKEVFDSFGKPFEGPVARALDTFGAALVRMQPAFQQMGASMAPIIDRLAPALASMAEKSLPGIQNALDASKPLWDTLAAHLPDIGEAISSFFDSIAEGGPGANKFLSDFLTWLEGAIILLGKVIGFLANLYGKAREVWIGIGKVFAEGVRIVLAVLGKIIGGAAAAFGWIPGIGPKLKNAAREFAEFQKDANHELDKITGKTVHIDVTLRGITNLEEQMAVRLGRRAHGGPVKAGTPYLVGEEGPELITPTRDGYVHDARATARALAASSLPAASTGRGGGFDEARLASAIARAMSRMTLRMEDPTGRYVTLLSRGDG